MVKALSDKLVARGGTELMVGRINTLPAELLSHFNIMHSRETNISFTKKNILVLHDLALDPMHNHLRDGGWKNFDKLVFVSHWQKQQFQDYLGVPPSASVILKNAITPIEDHVKPTDKIRLMYYSTPHRGLDILYAAFIPLAKEFPNLELNVFSSFDLYAWPERDEQHKDLFEKLEEHPQINYSKSVSNDRIRDELKRNHILAYPSTWAETSCLVLIEAMSAGLTCVHSSLAALPETSLSLTHMYDYHEDKYTHSMIFYNNLRQAIIMHNNENILVNHANNLAVQKSIADVIYNWDNRKTQWERLLMNILAKSG
jgi:glycosyltransferase involved in cell wall biosynthesis